jgi:hypothetical protein
MARWIRREGRDRSIGGRRLSRRVIALAAALGFLILSHAIHAAELARDGKPLATIVVPASALAVESYAAKELLYHVQIASGAILPIVFEADRIPSGPRVYLGRCQAAGAAKIDPSDLPGNGYIIKTVGENLFIAGNDSRGDPLDLDTHEGTLFGVYDLLESQLQVRWLWPGKLGEVIPHRETISFDPPDATVQPLLWFKLWRGGRSEGEKIWLKRQRFGRSMQPKYGHSFGDYWARFNQTHPEYFSMLPDGTRRLDPDAEGDTQYVHMCVSEPGLVKKIIADWKTRGTEEYLNMCENKG